MVNFAASVPFRWWIRAVTGVAAQLALDKAYTVRLNLCDGGSFKDWKGCSWFSAYHADHIYSHDGWISHPAPRRLPLWRKVPIRLGVRAQILAGRFGHLVLCLFVWAWIAAARLQPVLEVLDEEPLPSQLSKSPLSGFVAMEYFWLILNRTYVVFIAPEGLYGWKVRGPVTNADRTFYEPYQEMLKDDEFMRDWQAIEKLSRLRGGFVIERMAIVSVEYNERQKWGMGGIPHSGRINVKLSDGKTREFILLGFAIGDELVNRMVATLGVTASNTVQV
jgi:hypothetical protein